LPFPVDRADRPRRVLRQHHRDCLIRNFRVANGRDCGWDCGRLAREKELSSAIVVMIGDGNTTVVFLSTPISTRLCRLRSCSASGWAIMMSEASPNAVAARCSPPR